MRHYWFFFLKTIYYFVALPNIFWGFFCYFDALENIFYEFILFWGIAKYFLRTLFFLILRLHRIFFLLFYIILSIIEYFLRIFYWFWSTTKYLGENRYFLLFYVSQLTQMKFNLNLTRFGDYWTLISQELQNWFRTNFILLRFWVQIP